eukprot:TRINITY_DN3743_c0_g1_i3.p1 TRINITY_DN3743_c0_g1~~TRINITY_DN3743_c0_g1_i3.p1  ORF type:complete len:164 (+),score=26.99 TRINITY_DN3743_c0_g1_i3:81-572(+)
MANQSAKKIKAQNEKELRNILLISAIALCLFGSVRFFVLSYSLWHVVGLLIALGLLYFCYSSLSSFAKPQKATPTSEETHNDLRQQGLCEYYFDVIYITWFVLVTSLLSDWFWIVYLTIPGFAGWKLWQTVLQPYLAASSTTPQEPNSTEDKKKPKYRTIRAR